MATLHVTGGGSGPNSPYTFTAGGVTLTGNATFDVADNGTAVGNYPGVDRRGGHRHRSLTKTGAGTLVLAGTDTYTGGTIVDAGTLAVTTSTALPAGTSLPLPQAGRSVRSVVQRVAGDGGAVSAGAVAAVPEPGTLALLMAGLVAGFGIWRRRTHLERRTSELS